MVVHAPQQPLVLNAHVQMASQEQDVTQSLIIANQTHARMKVYVALPRTE